MAANRLQSRYQTIKIPMAQEYAVENYSAQEVEVQWFKETSR